MLQEENYLNQNIKQKILNNLKFKTAFIKKKYHDQEDEQKILLSHGKLFCKKNRVDALKEAINENIEVAIFDDGLQDKILDYNITFVCFNIQTWVGNSLCIPSGPLREDLKSIGKGTHFSKLQPLFKVLEVYCHTTDVRGREKYFVEDYQEPLNNFLDMDTTNKSIEECLDEILTVYRQMATIS